MALSKLELNERIAVLYGISQSKLTDKSDFVHFTEQLIRDCIEAVTPRIVPVEEIKEAYKGDDIGAVEQIGRNMTVWDIQANATRLLG